MGTPYLSEVKIVSFNFPPKGWAMCNGQLLPINQNQALFSLLGTMYGGDGRVNFALPDLRGRAPIHMGAGFTEGQRGGEVAHTLTISEMTAHNHVMAASNVQGNTLNPRPQNTSGTLFAQDPGKAYSANLSNAVTLNAGTITNTGGSQPHNNLQPYLVLNYIIALQGIFPSQN